MIRRIGVIYQDGNSLGFLAGLRDRLDCAAEFVDPPAAIGRQRVMRRKDAKLAWRHFQKQGVDLVVRFTDADGHSWRKVQRTELDRVPNAAKSTWVCGVAVENTEDWLALDTDYLTSKLDVSRTELENPGTRTGHIKTAIKLATAVCASETVSKIVSDAPQKIFRRWLQTSESLRQFYQDCRQADCDTPNEQ